jgi:transaldolase
MAQTVLGQLRMFSRVVVDTGDFELIRKFEPVDVTTNPTLILKAVQQPQYDHLVRLAERVAAEKGVDFAIDHLFVSFGTEILRVTGEYGRVSIEVDSRLSFDSEGTVARARNIMALCEANGIPRRRVLIKIAATWEGICAAKILESDGIRCNLTLLFSKIQAIACAEAGVTLISPFVGRILDWYREKTRIEYGTDDDPGVKSVVEIFNYYKHFEYKTEIMAASFRNIGEILALAGCDLLTISPQLLEQLHSSTQKIDRKLSPEVSKSMQLEKLFCDEKIFRHALASNTMASEKLAEGIKNFSADIEKIAEMLTQRR